MSNEQEASLLNERNIAIIHEALLKTAQGFALSLGVPEESTKLIVLAMTELGSALGEAKLDLSFVKQRRGVSSPSVGKVAGVLTFRLCRHNIFHLPPNIAELEKFTSFKENVVLLYVLHNIIKVRITDPWLSGSFPDTAANQLMGGKKSLPNIVRELRYMLTRRHYNQEILGVLYDTIRIIRQMSQRVTWNYSSAFVSASVLMA